MQKYEAGAPIVNKQFKIVSEQWLFKVTLGPFCKTIMSVPEEYPIGNLSVRFPYEPYEVQKAYMSRVLNCLQVNDGATFLF